MNHAPFEIIEEQTIGNNVFTLRGIAGVIDDRGNPQTFFYLEILRDETRLNASKITTSANAEEAAVRFQEGIDKGREKLERIISKAQHNGDAVEEMYDLGLLITQARYAGRQKVRALMGLSPIDG